MSVLLRAVSILGPPQDINSDQLARRRGPVQTPGEGKIFKAQLSLRKKHVLLV
jgi:hypothetical protein